MKRILISHSWSNPASHNQISGILDRHGYAFFNHSILSENPLSAINVQDLQNQLSDRISRVSTVVLAATKDAHKKPLVQFEIEEALRQGKRLVAVKPLGLASAPIPKIVNEYADAIVGFRGDQISAAIDGADIRNLSSYLIAEQEDWRNLAHWVCRSASGAIILGASTLGNWLPRLNNLLEGLGYSIAWKDVPPNPNHVLGNMAFWGGLGFLVGSIAGGRWPSTLALAGCAAAGAWTIGPRLAIKTIHEGNQLAVRYDSLPFSRMSAPRHTI